VDAHVAAQCWDVAVQEAGAAQLHHHCRCRKSRAGAWRGMAGTQGRKSAAGTTGLAGWGRSAACLGRLQLQLPGLHASCPRACMQPDPPASQTRGWRCSMTHRYSRRLPSCSSRAGAGRSSIFWSPQGQLRRGDHSIRPANLMTPAKSTPQLPAPLPARSWRPSCGRWHGQLSLPPREWGTACSSTQQYSRTHL
jgi:hypothetical protein